MSYITVYKEVAVDVDMDDFDDDDLIYEIQRRGYEVYHKNEGEAENIKDDIFALYTEWLTDQGDRDNRFDKAMRKFFEKHLNKASV